MRCSGALQRCAERLPPPWRAMLAASAARSRPPRITLPPGRIDACPLAWMLPGSRPRRSMLGTAADHTLPLCWRGGRAPDPRGAPVTGRAGATLAGACACRQAGRRGTWHVACWALGYAGQGSRRQAPAHSGGHVPTFSPRAAGKLPESSPMAPWPSRHSCPAAFPSLQASRDRPTARGAPCGAEPVQLSQWAHGLQKLEPLPQSCDPQRAWRIPTRSSPAPSGLLAGLQASP